MTLWLIMRHPQIHRVRKPGQNPTTPPTPHVIESLESRTMLIGISGAIFQDANADRLFGNGEIGQPNVHVYLDSNQNGILDQGEPATTTDSAGAYRFFNLEPGIYAIGEQVPSGWIQ